MIKGSPVTPFTGVWIEIGYPFAGVLRGWCHTLHGCVDRNAENRGLRNRASQVTPFTGVWIEMGWSALPSRSMPLSHPSRVCGSKFHMPYTFCSMPLVTPFTGVWIEIGDLGSTSPPEPVVTPFTGVWIEIACGGCATSGGVGHTLHGCVDRNIDPPDIHRLRLYVTPFTGVWIEIQSAACIVLKRSVTPFTGVWIEIRS